MTLSNIQSNASRGLLGNTTFLSAGAVKPAAAEDTDANQCSLGELYRVGKRGGPFIAINADIPHPSIYVSHLYICLEGKPCLQAQNNLPALGPPHSAVCWLFDALNACQ